MPKGIFKKHVTQKIEIFESPSPRVKLCHLSPRTPSPLVTSPNVTNFGMKMTRLLMQILGLNFAHITIIQM